jgi:hypothetical protein
MTIRALYTRISELAVGAVQARDLDEIKLAVRAEDCPLRLLLPSTTGDQGFVAIGTLSNTEWAIRDLCLWQPIVAGSGIEQCANDLLAYIELYAAAIRAMRSPGPGASVESVSFKLGPVLWGVVTYWAVDVQLLINELLQ